MKMQALSILLNDHQVKAIAYFIKLYLNRMMKQIVPVIVIGAGISGIAASTILSKNGIKHIILESRNRIGGRIFAADFNGDIVQLGGHLVHHPYQNNSMAQLIKELQWPVIHGDLQKQQVFCEGVGQLQDQMARKGWVYHKEILQNFKQQANKSEKDISVIEAASEYVNSIKVEGAQKLLIKWVLSLYGCIEAASITQLSAKQFQVCMSQDDFYPRGGFNAIIDALVKKYSPQIILNKRVTKIDYQQQIVKITTENGDVYQCERVISSLPLGILEKKVVEFKPELPQNHKIAIDKIGKGTLNKLFVSLAQPFWDIKKNILNFYTQKQTPMIVARAISTQTQNILCFYVAGQQSKYLSELSKQELFRQVAQYFSMFKLQKQVKIKDVYVTSWHKDKDSLGSYSFSKVGTQRKHFSDLRESISKKLWFVGEHCNEIQNACVHSAYQTGVWAAEQISKIYLNK